MSDETAKTPKKKFRWGRLLGVLLFLLVAAGVGYGLSWLNARTYYLVVGQTEVRIGKGRMLPVGYEQFVPKDPALRPAYEPFPLPGGMPLTREERKLGDRVELDQALYRLLEEAAQYTLEHETPRTPRLVSTYLERLEALPGLNAEQRAGIAELRRRALYVEAKGHRAEAIEALEQAAEKFRASAAGAPVASKRDAEQTADRIEHALRVLRVGAAPTAPEPAPPPVSTGTTTTASAADR